MKLVIEKWKILLAYKKHFFRSKTWKVEFKWVFTFKFNLISLKYM